MRQESREKECVKDASVTIEAASCMPKLSHESYFIKFTTTTFVGRWVRYSVAA